MTPQTRLCGQIPANINARLTPGRLGLTRAPTAFTAPASPMASNPGTDSVINAPPATARTPATDGEADYCRGSRRTAAKSRSATTGSERRRPGSRCVACGRRRGSIGHPAQPLAPSVHASPPGDSLLPAETGSPRTTRLPLSPLNAGRGDRRHLNVRRAPGNPRFDSGRSGRGSVALSNPRRALG